MKSSLFIPKTIKVGYQNRADTYTGKLAYVIYYDEQGKLRKETSWNSWRDEKIPDNEFENEPTEGFVLNKKVGGYQYHYDMRQTYVRVYDPRGFEFEITIPNLLYILENANSIKGKGLEGEFVYSWDGKDIVLLPVDSPDYKELNELNKKRFSGSYIKAKDLKIGATYLNKNNIEVVYMGRFPYYSYGYVFDDKEFTSYSSMQKYAEENNFYLSSTKSNVYRHDSTRFYKNKDVNYGKYYWFAAVDRSIELEYWGWKVFKSIPKGWLLNVISEEPISDYSTRYDSLESCNKFSPIDESKDRFVHHTLEEFQRYILGCYSWNMEFLTYWGNQYIVVSLYKSDDNDGFKIYTNGRIKIGEIDYKKIYSIEEIYKLFHPCYKEIYLANGRLYRRKYYE